MKKRKYTILGIAFLLSLFSKTWAQFDEYVELEKHYSTSNNNDSLLYILDQHYKRALLYKDSSEQLKVLTWIYWYNQNYSKDHILKDSLLNSIELLGGPSELSKVYYTVASKDYEKGDIKSSAQNLDKSLKIALQHNDYKQALESIKAFASLQDKSKKNENTISDLNYLKWLISKDKSIDEIKKRELLQEILIEKSAVFLNWGLLDSAAHSTRLMSKNLDGFKNATLGKFKLLEATLNYRIQYFLNAKDSLEKYLPILDNTQTKDAWYVLSLIEKKLGNSFESDLYLKRIDSALESEGYPQYSNGVSTYRRLLSVSEDSLKNKYLGLFQHYENYSSLGDTLFDKTSSIKQPSKFISPAVLISLLLLGSITIFWLFTSMTKNKKIENKLTIAKEGNYSFKMRLHEWENDKGFLEPNTTLASLATLLETNTSYLSKYFNKEKKSSFSNYLSKLRINQLIEIISHNPSIIKSKSSIQIAESLGFKSIDSYSRAFKITTGCTPNQYIKKVLSSE